MACRGRYAPLVPRGHRRLGGRLTTVRRASRLSGSSGASARGAGSQGSVSSGIRSPPVRVLAPASRTREPSELPPASRSTASDAALTPCPAIFRGAEHESLRSQYAGEPATGCVGLLFVAVWVMVCPSPQSARISKWRRPSSVSPRRPRRPGSHYSVPMRGCRYGAIQVTG